MDSTLNGRPPRIIAHRGSSHVEPEHTLGAYLRALDEGADGVECDVRLTADKHLVCVHDRRIDRTSNGVGVVSSLELAELEGFDWGSWKQAHPGDNEVPDRHHTQILTLKTLLRTMIESGRPIEVAIETKHPTRYAGEVEHRLVQVLREFDLLRPRPGQPVVRMMSFSTLAINRMARIAPQIPRVQLVELPGTLRLLDNVATGVKIVGPGIHLLRATPKLVVKQHALGHEVHVWTVDKPDDIQRCLDLGVDAIITNTPAAVREAVQAAYPDECD